jgi:hypothetical protein
MTLEGWIFMVGLRVFDVGALIVWLVWFFRLREDDDDDGRDDGHGGGPADEPPRPPAPGGDGIPLPDADPWPHRRRDHAGDCAPATAPARTTPPHPAHPATPARTPARR